MKYYLAGGFGVAAGLDVDRAAVAGGQLDRPPFREGWHHGASGDRSSYGQNQGRSRAALPASAGWWLVHTPEQIIQ